ncbi:MAG: hypothetical protein ABJA34_04090 [Pseudonocardiales bacterium]
MSWTWRYLTSVEGPATRPSSEAFPTQADAESWLGESWRDLLDQGVERVTLLEDGRDEYTMSLSPAT